jgi:hypothetical protein
LEGAFAYFSADASVLARHSLGKRQRAEDNVASSPPASGLAHRAASASSAQRRSQSFPFVSLFCYLLALWLRHYELLAVVFSFFAAAPALLMGKPCVLHVYLSTYRDHKPGRCLFASRLFRWLRRSELFVGFRITRDVRESAIKKKGERNGKQHPLCQVGMFPSNLCLGYVLSPGTSQQVRCLLDCLLLLGWRHLKWHPFLVASSMEASHVELAGMSHALQN